MHCAARPPADVARGDEKSVVATRAGDNNTVVNIMGVNFTFCFMVVSLL